MRIKALTVSQVNHYLKRILQSDPILSNVTITGEISNYKVHSSGHVYFVLKDAESKINCFLPEIYAKNINLTDGLKIKASGYINIYEKNGNYTFNIIQVESDGIGDLHIKLETLKKKLEKEGLFDQKQKKAIPRFAKKIAIITSPTGAAIRDIIKTIRNKNEIVDLFIFPVLVQGPLAPSEISETIDQINQIDEKIDIIIVGRGGGSFEELWAFNEENVARSIYHSKIPVISAVGHETDFSIADFVSDLRAATPTAAAEIAVPNISDEKDKLDMYFDYMNNFYNKSISNKEQLLRNFDFEKFKVHIEHYCGNEKNKLDQYAHAMSNIIEKKFFKEESQLLKLNNFIEELNPIELLKKGYTLITDKDKKYIFSSSQISPGDQLNIHFYDGRVETAVKDVKKGE